MSTHLKTKHVPNFKKNLLIHDSFTRVGGGENIKTNIENYILCIDTTEYPHMYNYVNTYMKHIFDY